MPQLAFGRSTRQAEPIRRRRFLIADALLEVSSAHRLLLDELDARYGDCAAAQLPGTCTTVRCSATRLAGTPYLALDFEGESLPDPFEAALTPFRLLRHLKTRIGHDLPEPGWRALLDPGDGETVLLAGRSRRLLVNVEAGPVDRLTDCVIAVAQAAQPSVAFLHAASFAVGGRGGILVGRSYGGKSTTVLTLAQRGHAFLGDDTAAVRLPGKQLVPFRKSAGMREGPLSSAIESRACRYRHMPATGLDGVPRKLVRVGDMFPGSCSGPCPLNFAFVLDGFSKRPALTPYAPRLGDVERLKCIVCESVPGWGLAPGRDLMNFLKALDILSHVRCYLLRLGSPEESAMLIEETMEETCSTLLNAVPASRLSAG